MTGSGRKLRPESLTEYKFQSKLLPKSDVRWQMAQYNSEKKDKAGMRDPTAIELPFSGDPVSHSLTPSQST